MLTIIGILPTGALLSSVACELAPLKIVFYVFLFSIFTSLTYISLLIIPCIIYHVTNKEPWTLDKHHFNRKVCFNHGILFFIWTFISQILTFYSTILFKSHNSEFFLKILNFSGNSFKKKYIYRYIYIWKIYIFM